MRKLAVLLGVLAFGLSAAPAFGQATRTWVSGTGNDVDPCSFTAPCKTFAGAYGKTLIGGEINAMSDGGFGTLNIGHSITIDGNGHHASILSSGATGVNINIPANPDDPNRRVVLRNLSINGAGSMGGTVGTNTGLHGVRVTTNGAETVELENLRIFGFTQNGITVVPGSGSPSVLNMSLDNVFVADNFGNAFDLRVPDASHSVNALVKDSTFKHSTGTTGTAGETGIGIAADTGTHVWLTGNAIFDNLVGLRTFSRLGSPGVIDSFCDNQIVGNADNGTAPNELCPKPVNPPAEVVTETVTVPGPPQCTVPKLKGLQLAFAKRLLKAAHCALGKVTRKKARRRSQVGKVLSQKTRAGTALAQGTKVAVTVGHR